MGTEGIQGEAVSCEKNVLPDASFAIASVEEVMRSNGMVMAVLEFSSRWRNVIVLIVT